MSVSAAKEAPLAFFPARNGPPRACTLVVHGLNNTPSTMRSVVHFLVEHGSDVVLVGLRGHCGDGQSLRGITSEHWLADLRRAYQYVHTINETPVALPVYFVGYSLGALVNLSLLSRYPDEFRCERMVLLAPANALRRRTHLIRPFFRIPANWVVPSFTPCGYRANKGISKNLYQALFQLAQSLDAAAYRHLNIPTLVVIDPKDELISPARLQRLLVQHQLTHWELMQLAGKPTGKGPHFHHLIVDEACLGTENWVKFTARLGQFFQLAATTQGVAQPGSDD